jgi:tight adherence protein B
MSTPARRCVTGIATAIAAAVLVLGSASVACAQDSSTLSIESVSGREVTAVMTLDPSIAVTPSSTVRGTVEVGGVVVPATASLDVVEKPPKVAVLALDTSGSMAGKKMADARSAATAFVKAMPADVKVGLVTFNDSVQRRVEPTLNRPEILAAIDSTKAGGFTSLYDGILAALDSLPEGEKARVLLLSDGKDTVSSGTFDHAGTVDQRRGGGCRCSETLGPNAADPYPDRNSERRVAQEGRRFRRARRRIRAGYWLVRVDGDAGC